MKKLSLLAAFVVASLAATAAHAQTTSTLDQTVPAPSTQQTYQQQRTDATTADQAVKDQRRAYK